METNRKRRKRKKWYVVWKGVNPGIYESWQECQEVGQPDPTGHKSFRTYEEAYAAFHGIAFGTASNASTTPIILTVEEVNKLCSGGRYKRRAPLYAAEIESMKQGEGLVIKAESWHRKTSIGTYFHTKFNKQGKAKLGTRRLQDGSYLVFKQ